MAFRHNKLTGGEVGRLVLRDLAVVHHNTREGRDEPTLSPAEKADLVNALTEPAEVAAYNDYRYFHEFLSRAALTFNLHQQTSDSCYWQLCYFMETLRLAERENLHQLNDLPRIMTRGQYDQARSLFNPSGGEGFGRGVAIVEIDGFPENTYKVGKDGRFQYPPPGWRQSKLAERFLDYGGHIRLLLISYQEALKETLVVKTAVDLAARFLGVPELEYLVGEVDLLSAEILNRNMAELPGLIGRRGFFPDERPEDELRAELGDLLRPIDVKKLKPTAQAKAKARRALDFSVARGQAERIYAILRGEADA